MKTVKVWDIFVRVFHWTLVATVILQLLTAESAKSVHAIIGYLIIILILARVVWGFVGTQHARFSDFIYPPKEILAYLKGIFTGNPRHYTGHNPAGGAMVFVLLFFLLLTTTAGLKTLGMEGKGPFAGLSGGFVNAAYADQDQDKDHEDAEDRGPHANAGKTEHFWKELHEFLVGVLISLIVIHICGVIVSSYLHRENLIWAMVTGMKKIEAGRK